MIYKGPGFLAVLGFGSSPTPSPVSKLDRRHKERPRKREKSLTGEGDKGVARSESLVLYKSFVLCVYMYIFCI